MSETKVQSIVAAVIAIINALVLLDLVQLSEQQISGISVALVAVMGCVRAFFAPEVSFVGKSE